MFLQSRKEDASVKEREHSLQSLDLAYHKYREITRNLDEGLKVMLHYVYEALGSKHLWINKQFYNDIGAILAQFKETCKGWVIHRRDEMR